MLKEADAGGTNTQTRWEISSLELATRWTGRNTGGVGVEDGRKEEVAEESVCFGLPPVLLLAGAKASEGGPTRTHTLAHEQVCSDLNRRMEKLG